MSEIWLHTNRRLYWLPVLVALVAAGLFVVTYVVTTRGAWTHNIAGGGAYAALALAGYLLYLARLPRLAFDGRSLLMRLRNGAPIAVPIDLVEAFLLGKGPAYLGGRDDYKTEARTLIIRIAERAPEFEKLETNLRLAAWCGHYVTLRGTFTEPLDVDLVNRLNQRLYDAQQTLRAERDAVAPQPS